MIPFQNWSQGQSHNVSQGPTWSPTLLVPYSSDPSPYVPLRLQPCSLLCWSSDWPAHSLLPGYLCVYYPSAQALSPQIPSWLTTSPPSSICSNAIFQVNIPLKIIPSNPTCLIPLALYVFPQSIYRTMYLLFLVAVIYCCWNVKLCERRGFCLFSSLWYPCSA